MTFTPTHMTVFGFDIYFYGLLIALGAALGLFFAVKREKAMELKRDTAVDMALISLPAGILGARAYYVLMNPGEFTSLSSVINLRSGGLAIYGGILAGAGAVFVASLIRKQSFVSLCDLLLPCAALSQAVGRWGNFINQEAYGREVTLGILRFFPLAVNIEGTFYAAAFFYESVYCLFIFLLTNVFRSKTRYLKRGAGTLAYGVIYGLGRCAVEGLRTDSLYLGPVRISQVLSALTALAAFIILCRAVRPKAAFYIPGLCACVFLPVCTLFPGLNPYVYPCLPFAAGACGILLRKYTQS